jgi:hypothetical protein
VELPETTTGAMFRAIGADFARHSDPIFRHARGERPSRACGWREPGAATITFAALDPRFRACEEIPSPIIYSPPPPGPLLRRANGWSVGW